ncbi:acyl-CoA desaturase 4 [Mus pahari]|uniref:acyl-CoA desaturase 4 n=1 Tax=Mus pahari TaxID=10093 RepID=UPI000A30E1D1|nr:acyl-CoA desaturase 4 [Mus pahari]
MMAHLPQEISSRCSTTNTMEPHSWRQQDGEEKMPLQAEDIRPEIKDDLYDPTYQDEEGPPPKLEYVWKNIIFMALLHVGALYGITLVPSCKVYTWLLGVFYNVVAGLGITAGAHRLWSHRTYKARLPLRIFLIMANTMAFQPQCVISPRRYYKLAVTLIFIILPTLVPWYLWGETFRHSLCVANFLRYAVLLNFTWLVNSAAHLYGYRPYDKGIGARENPLVSMASFGEGFHNYHHAFPYDYSVSEYRWHINFTTFFIDCMAALGLAYDRKKVSKAVVLARIKRTGDGSHKSS